MTLNGRTVLVTRPKNQAQPLVDDLTKLGATVYQLPAVEILPIEDFADLDRALANLEQYDWILLTSRNGVEALADRMDALNIPTEKLANQKIATIGPGTAAEFEQNFGRQPDLIPREFVAESLDAALEEVQGKRILLARADIARKDLAISLKQRGAQVDEVALYRIVTSEEDAQLPEKAPDYILLTSAYIAKATAARLGEAGRADWMTTSNLICIGPIAAQKVEELGYKVAATAQTFDIPGLTEALINHANREEANV